MAACSLGLHCRVSEKCAPALRQADTTGPEPNALSPRTRICPVAPADRAVVIACFTREAADRADAALPPRSLVAATTGAARSVLIAATNGERPRSFTL